LSTKSLIYVSFLPEIILGAFALLIMCVDPFLKKREKVFSTIISIFAIVVAFISNLLFLSRDASLITFNGMIYFDFYSNLLRGLFLLIGFLVSLFAFKYIEREDLFPGEFSSLLLFALIGMDLMAISANLIMTFIGLEILSMSTYILAGFKRKNLKSNESALKYFILGGVSSAILLYGISFLYGFTGTLSYRGIANVLSKGSGFIGSPLLFLGMGMILVGFGFKIALAPFHVWTPDVYEGAPTVVSGFMSVGPKAAGYAALLRIVFQIFPFTLPLWRELFVYSAILTMLIGNLGAIIQKNVKRLLGYSSIAHAGYMLLGIIAADVMGMSGIIFYLFAYLFMNLGAFGVISIFEGKGEKFVTIDDYRGIGFKYPQLTFPLSIFLLSLAGIPLTAGFVGKFVLFGAALMENHMGLVLIAILASLISVYYYLKVIVYMFMKSPIIEGEEIEVRYSGVALFSVLVCAFFVLYLGLFPSYLLNLSKEAVVFLGI